MNDKKKPRRISTRSARRIRRGIIGAQLAHAALEAGDGDRAEQIYYVVSAFGGITQKALFREFARLVTTSSP